MRGHELEVLDHRMVRRAELARDLHALVAGGDGGKGDAGIHDILLDAIEPPEEVEVPPGAAELAVGDGLQADLLLLLDDPSVTACRPTSSCFLMTRSISRSSTSFSCAGVISPLARFSRACFSAAGRSRLPT
jgi:hypothetical protein